MITDALEMGAVSATVGVEEGAVLAIAAGADALCLGHDLDDVAGIRQALVDAVRAGRLPEERLAEAAARVERVGRWTASAGIGLEAARRALHVEGSVELTRPALVVELVPEATIAAGPAGHTFGEILAARSPAPSTL